MVNFLEKNCIFISFLLVPIFYLWNPNWLGFLGIQPYWPLFWLLPFSLVHGSTKGLIVGLFLGLILDSLSTDDSFTQIPGLVLCGFWFGRVSNCSNIFVKHFRHGLMCSLGSFICGGFYFLQILIKNIPENNLFLYFPSTKNIFAQVFVTGLLAPLFCSRILILFRKSKDKKNVIRLFN